MATINSLARELGAQPHEVAAFAGLDRTRYDVPLDAMTVRMIREAWESAPRFGD